MGQYDYMCMCAVHYCRTYSEVVRGEEEEEEEDMCCTVL